MQSRFLLIGQGVFRTTEPGGAELVLFLRPIFVSAAVVMVSCCGGTLT